MKQFLSYSLPIRVGKRAYQTRLRDVATGFGIDRATFDGMRAPVLVRERLDDVDRAAFAREANAPPVLQMFTLEDAVLPLVEFA